MSASDFSAPKVRPIRADDYERIYEPIARSVFAIHASDDLWKPEHPHFMRSNWTSVLLPCDVLRADPWPDHAETNEIDARTGLPPIVRDPWLEAIWVPFMDTVIARSPSEIVFMDDWFPPGKGPQFSWLERFLYRWVFRAPLDVDEKVDGPAQVLPYGVVGPPEWDAFAEVESLHPFIQSGVYFVFPADARWGAYCEEDSFTLLGGEPGWMAEFAARSGGFGAIRARFLDDGPQWPRRLSTAELADRRERLLRLADWGHSSA